MTLSTAIWIAILSALLGWELFCLWDGDPHTWTLTRTVITYVPWWVTLGFVTWLWIHFALRYWR